MRFAPTSLLLLVALTGAQARAQTDADMAPTSYPPVIPAPQSPAPVVYAPPVVAEPTARSAGLPVHEVALQLHPVEHFGRRGQVFLSGATGATVVGQHVQLHGVAADQFTIDVSTSIGAFGVDNFAYGLSGGADYTSIKPLQSISLLVGPFLGYNVPMHRMASFFPTLALLYRYTNTMADAASSTFLHEIDVRLELSFLAHVVDHLSLSATPYVTQSVFGRTGMQQGTSKSAPKVQSPYATSYGMHFGVVGWF